MAPPGILFTDEHLDAVRSVYKSISVPAFSPPSKRSPSPSRGVNTSIFHDHDYVSPQHQQQQQQQQFSESSTDSSSYENDITSIGFDDYVSKTVAQVDDATGVDGSHHGDTTTLSSKHSVDNSTLVGSNDGRLIENIDSNNTPISWFMDAADGDFLDELDDFDLELDEFDPCIDMDTEDSFQHFIEETLNSPTTSAYMDEEYEPRNGTDETEDIHKKEYFLKLLGLQSVSHTAQSNSAIREDCDTNTTCPHTFVQGTSPVLTATDSGVDISEEAFACQGNRPSHDFSSSAISPHLSSLSTSVPAKMCSCAASDWKDSLLYSTAPACSSGHVQTNLSTAPTKSITYNMAAQNFRFTSNLNNADTTHSSPSVGGALNNFEDLTACSSIRDGLQLKNQSDADAFLRWLEEDGETVPLAQAQTEMSERSDCTNFKNYDMSAQSTVAETNNCVPESNHPSASQSIPDLDSFIDLETYAMEKSPPSIQFGLDTHSNNYLSNQTRASKVHSEEKLGHIKSKYPPGSELRFRLSLLDDPSCWKDRYLEKRDASCPFGVSAVGFNGSCKDYTFNDPLADLMSEAASSPLSPYSSSSSSSVNSSYGQHKEEEDSLDLLGLFSEENSFLLMEQSDSRYGFC